MKKRNPSRPEKPKSHEEWQILVSAYSDGEVTPEEQAWVESHLAGCAECGEMLAGYGRLSKTIHAMPQGAPSRTLVQRVQEGIARPRLALWRRLAPFASAAALLLIAFTLWGALQGGLAPLKLRRIAGEAQPAAPAATVQAPKSAPGQPTEGFMRTMESQGAVEETNPAPAQMLGAGGQPTATCPGLVLAYEVTSLSMRTDANLAAPRLRGTVLDTADKALPGLTIVVSSTTGWQGAAITDERGVFTVDLPEPGQYRVALAVLTGDTVLNSTASPTGTYRAYLQDRSGYDSLDEKGFRLYSLPQFGPCLAPLNLAMPPVSLDVHDEAVVVLRVR